MGDRRSNTRGGMAMEMDVGMGMAGPAGIRSRVEGGGTVGGGGARAGGVGERGGPVSGLRITNPELLGPRSTSAAHTPWDGEVMVLCSGRELWYRLASRVGGLSRLLLPSLIMDLTLQCCHRFYQVFYVLICHLPTSPLYNNPKLSVYIYEKR